MLRLRPRAEGSPGALRPRMTRISTRTMATTSGRPPSSSIAQTFERVRTPGVRACRSQDRRTPCLRADDERRGFVIISCDTRRAGATRDSISMRVPLPLFFRTLPPLEDPIRSDLFGIERLEQHAASLATAQRVTRGTVDYAGGGVAGRQLLRRRRTVARPGSGGNANAGVAEPPADGRVHQFSVVMGAT